MVMGSNRRTITALDRRGFSSRRSTSQLQCEVGKGSMTSTRTIYVLAGAAPVVVHNGNCFGGTWSDDNNLDEHFRKHGEEMGFDTMTECNCAA